MALQPSIPSDVVRASPARTDGGSARRAPGEDAGRASTPPGHSPDRTPPPADRWERLPDIPRFETYAEPARGVRIDVDGAALRQRLSANLAQHFGASSAFVGEVNGMIDWFGGADPALAQSLLVLMSIMSEEDPGAVENMMASLRKTRELMSSAFGGDARASAEVSVFRVNIEAAASATTARVAPEGGGERVFSAGSYSVRVEAQVVHVRVETAEAPPPEQGDPLVLDLDGDGIDLRSAEDGIDFDLEGSGETVRTAFVAGDDALLYVDRNGNGVVDDGRELFGDQEGDAHGFAELARHDANEDGVIDARDEVWKSLRLWQDRNADGVNQIVESLTPERAGVASIGLRYAEALRDDGKGNTLAQIGSFTRADGTTGAAADALLAFYR